MKSRVLRMGFGVWVLMLGMLGGVEGAEVVAGGGSTEWEIWLPPSGKAVRAVFVAPRWGDGANMVRLIQKNLGEELGVATMLTREDKLTFKEDHFVASIGKSLGEAAVGKNHPELAVAPLLLWAHSNAAAYVQRSLREMPERVVAYCLFKSAFGHNNDLGVGTASERAEYGYASVAGGEAKQMSVAAKAVFGLSIWDMNDRIKAPGYNQENERAVMLKHLGEARRQGALVGVALVKGTHHVIDGQQELMLGFFRAAMAMRLPAGELGAGPVKLVGGLEEAGWVQDGETKVVRGYGAGGAEKKRMEGWWMPTREYAVLWNGYALNGKGTVAERRMKDEG